MHIGKTSGSNIILLCPMPFDSQVAIILKAKLRRSSASFGMPVLLFKVSAIKDVLYFAAIKLNFSKRSSSAFVLFIIQLFVLFISFNPFSISFMFVESNEIGILLILLYSFVSHSIVPSNFPFEGPTFKSIQSGFWVVIFVIRVFIYSSLRFINASFFFFYMTCIFSAINFIYFFLISSVTK